MWLYFTSLKDWLAEIASYDCIMFSMMFFIVKHWLIDRLHNYSLELRFILNTQLLYTSITPKLNQAQLSGRPNYCTINGSPYRQFDKHINLALIMDVVVWCGLQPVRTVWAVYMYVANTLLSHGLLSAMLLCGHLGAALNVAPIRLSVSPSVHLSVCPFVRLVTPISSK